MKAKLSRIGWLSLAILFAVTGLGVGIWGFWQATHPPDASEAYISCQKDEKITEISAGGNKLEGTKLPNYTPVKQVSKLSCIDGVVGSGSTINSFNTITANYTGAMASSGVIFESSLDSGQPITVALNQVIEGWAKGLAGMQVGGTRRLMIPAEMAYGTQGSCKTVDQTDPTKCQEYAIAPNTPLVFDVSVTGSQ
ncbi:hypothetical protein A3A68_01595 [Candidatus Saccharibacteria bacterium RIFCSPLOWO2_01_FULL_48_13]|nr:MAG: hypothetical protein A2884_00830 [Candidatus Saccharibacteria bacterium RIFCSPHIGHO2_01_FULL_48_12]OGL35904.1 MAG: hypothetical protein A3F38_00165 [Candidatus Saccharibacteria bacterium RIFCSPHIGHO2_12_FULL_48_21]OGL37442.1 MAG: hypothetical protein A3A68_01595 [Candidatus Saccharibacteria bacterium RIFCSPLOWO2_01_FULL_48_13]